MNSTRFFSALNVSKGREGRTLGAAPLDIMSERMNVRVVAGIKGTAREDW